MSQSPIVHDTFTIERVLSAPPARVFEALSNAELKAKWFRGPAGWTEKERRLDFRVGGSEHVSGEHAGKLSSVFEARYLDIIAGERLVYVYEQTVNGRKISASLTTFQLFAEGAKTRLVLTEQGAYFPDPELHKYAPHGPAASRLEGTKGLMDQLAALFAP